jgi:hypothetical protein
MQCKVHVLSGTEGDLNLNGRAGSGRWWGEKRHGRLRGLFSLAEEARVCVERNEARGGAEAEEEEEEEEEEERGREEPGKWRKEEREGMPKGVRREVASRGEEREGPSCL